MISGSPAANDLRDRAIVAWMHDFAPYGVITTDTSFCVQSWNRWMENHSGRQSEEVRGQSLFHLYPELVERGLFSRFERSLAGEVNVLSTALHGYLLPMEPTFTESGFKRMQQTARIAPLVLEGQVVGTIVVIEDVTQRELQARVVRRQHERESLLSWALAHLLESAEPGRTIRELFCKVAEFSDFDTYLLYLLSPAGDSMFLHGAGGMTPELEQELAVLKSLDPLSQAFHSATEATACEKLHLASSPLQTRLDFRGCAVLPLRSPQGLFGFLCFGSRIRDTLEDGELELLSTIGKYLAVALYKEATGQELHAAQQKLNQHAQDLETQVAERTAKLREIIGELETFSYTLAHDLRAPIRALTGYSEVLIEDYSNLLPGDGRLILERQLRACKQLDGMTRDLLDFSRVSRQEIDLTPVPLDEVVRDVISLLPDARRVVSVREPLPRVRAQRSLLQQCLANLVDNALKFAREGEPVSVSVWAERACKADEPEEPATRPAPFTSVLPALRPVNSTGHGGTGAAARVRIVVQDRGIGIPPEAQGKIFGIFERGTSSPKYQGSGIGLAIVARAIQRMGGSYGVESEPGVGSRFWLELPEA